MSESERTPGYRNRSHVPPRASRASRTAHTSSGRCFASRQATSTPEMPGADDEDVDVERRGLHERRRGLGARHDLRL